MAKRRAGQGEAMRYLVDTCTTAAAHDPGWPFGCFNERGGYGQVRFEGQATQVHRAAWVTVHGPIPDGLWVLHQCDTPRCFWVEHLFLGDHRANMADMWAKGRGWHAVMVGEAHPQAKLTEDDVRAIRTLTNPNYGVLSRQYGVSRSVIGSVVRRVTWKHVE